MATVFENISLKGLRKVHLSQLLQYLLDCEKSGSYYGNKNHFIKRQNELKEWLEDAVYYAYSEGVVLPK